MHAAAVVLGHTNNPLASDGAAEAVGFFIVQWVIMLGGAAVHVAVRRRRVGRQPGDAVKLLLLWVLVFGGFWVAYGGVMHASGLSDQMAESIGYAPSMFQWEVGWADIAVGVLGMGCAWRTLRDHWMTAAVVAISVSFFGDGIGHIMQWVSNDNTAPDNVWAIPSDFAQPLLAIVLLLAYRRAFGFREAHRSTLEIDTVEASPSS